MNSYVSLLGKEIDYLELKQRRRMIKKMTKKKMMTTKKMTTIQVKIKLKMENFPQMIPKVETMMSKKILQLQVISSLLDG